MVQCIGGLPQIALCSDFNRALCIVVTYLSRYIAWNLYQNQLSYLNWQLLHSLFRYSNESKVDAKSRHIHLDWVRFRCQSLTWLGFQCWGSSSFRIFGTTCHQRWRNITCLPIKKSTIKSGISFRKFIEFYQFHSYENEIFFFFCTELYTNCEIK